MNLMDARNELVRRGRSIAFETAATAVEAFELDRIKIKDFLNTLNACIDAEMESAIEDAGHAWRQGYQLLGQFTFETSMRAAGIRAAATVIAQELGIS